MILHTVIKPELIFNALQPTEQESNIRIIQWNNIKLEVKPAGESNYKINRIISTNPNDYLHPQLQPGMEFKLDIQPGE